MRGIAAVACVLLGVAVAQQAATATPGSTSCEPLRAPAAYAARVDRALHAGADVWGRQLLRAPGGASYAAARRYLAPLLLARTTHGAPLTPTGSHYVPFAASAPPGGTSSVSLHVADGSQILWDRSTGPALTVWVGRHGEERFGSCAGRLPLPALLDGSQPVLETRYADAAGNRYAQESFDGHLAGTDGSVAFARVSVAAKRATTIRLVVSRGGAVVARAPAGSTRTVWAAWPHGARRPEAIDEDTYDAARDAVTSYWSDRLSRGATFTVPDAQVMDAQRALLVENLILGWRYSIGNPYEEFSYPESLDVAQVMADFGFADTSAAILQTSFTRPPRAYANWRIGQELVAAAQQFRLFGSRAQLTQTTPHLARSLATIEAQLRGGSLLRREQYSSDIGDLVYGLHSQAVVWQGLAGMAGAWRAAGHPGLAARAGRAATRLGTGLRRAVRRSEQRLADRSLFVPVRLLDAEPAYDRVTASRDGSYWNLVVPYALGSGLFAPTSPEARGALRYLQTHGSRLLGLVRATGFALYGKTPRFPQSGTDEVYGLNVSRFLADLDEPDELVLSLYGDLAAGMAPGTFVSGEAASVAPLDGELDRSMYLPPNAASNASFLETLRLMLVHERPGGLDLAFSTPRRWLAPGQTVSVADAPTSYGSVSYELDAEASSIQASVTVAGAHGLRSLRLRLRVPPGARTTTARLGGRPLAGFHAGDQTLRLPARAGELDLVVGLRR